MDLGAIVEGCEGVLANQSCELESYLLVELVVAAFRACFLLLELPLLFLALLDVAVECFDGELRLVLKSQVFLLCSLHVRLQGAHLYRGKLLK